MRIRVTCSQVFGITKTTELPTPPLGITVILLDAETTSVLPDVVGANWDMSEFDIELFIIMIS